MLRVLGSTGGMFVSLILGGLLMAFIGINSPETLSACIGGARQVKIWLTSSVLPARYNVWLELLLEERQLVFMFFTLVARLVLAALTSLVLWLFGRATSQS
jgi:hypothetical protein